MVQTQTNPVEYIKPNPNPKPEGGEDPMFSDKPIISDDGVDSEAAEMCVPALLKASA